MTEKETPIEVLKKLGEIKKERERLGHCSCFDCILSAYLVARTAEELLKSSATS